METIPALILLKERCRKYKLTSFSLCCYLDIIYPGL